MRRLLALLILGAFVVTMGLGCKKKGEEKPPEPTDKTGETEPT